VAAAAAARRMRRASPSCMSSCSSTFCRRGAAARACTAGHADACPCLHPWRCETACSVSLHAPACHCGCEGGGPACATGSPCRPATLCTSARHTLHVIGLSPYMPCQGPGGAWHAGGLKSGGLPRRARPARAARGGRPPAAPLRRRWRCSGSCCARRAASATATRRRRAAPRRRRAAARLGPGAGGLPPRAPQRACGVRPDARCMCAGTEVWP